MRWPRRRESDRVEFYVVVTASKAALRDTHDAALRQQIVVAAADAMRSKVEAYQRERV